MNRVNSLARLGWNWIDRTPLGASLRWAGSRVKRVAPNFAEKSTLRLYKQDPLAHNGLEASQQLAAVDINHGNELISIEQVVADLTIVYSPPKVGGSTIAATVSRHPSIRTEVPYTHGVPHVHGLSPKGLALLEWELNQCGGHPNAHIWRMHIALCRWLRILLSAKRMLRTKGPPPIVRKPFLIGGLREPISLYLSWVFEVWWRYVDQLNALTADVVRARMAADPWAYWCNNWFTDDLREMFGVDVYARPFPTERGWDIYENDAARVLIIRQENLERLPAALGALYGFHPATVEVVTSNTALSKPYAPHYAAVKKSLRLSERELEKMYALPYVRHFYTPEEIEAFKERWRASRTLVENRRGLTSSTGCRGFCNIH